VSSTPISDTRAGPFVVRFPNDGQPLDQDQEWFEVEVDGQRRRLRLHDYAALYAVPGLYEAVVYDTLRCRSPGRIVGLLTTVLQDRRGALGDLRILDLGAGNGIVAERMRKAGARYIVGLDLIPEAAVAARRDRPGVYDDYLVADLDDLAPAHEQRLEKHSLNCLITVAALGFGDVPPAAFARAFNLITDGGWLALTIKEDFLDPDGGSGFGQLLHQMIADHRLEVYAHHRYCHRVSIAGEKLFYVGLVARKSRAVPGKMVTGSAKLKDTDNDTADYTSVLLRR
jgi:predicted TPR repeat methyltransferase